jgi:hypothetical protein
MTAECALPRLIVERMHLAVSVPCQYDCLSCSHQAIRYKFPGYHLPLDHLQEFIHFTEASGYLIRKLHLTGPGEPLLWKHLNEGLRLLRASPAIKEIYVISNGLSIHKIDNETWDNLDHVDVSLYPAFNKWERLNSALAVHKDKINVRHTGRFYSAPQKGDIAPIPCGCNCTGPMFFDRKVFFFCGPTVFGAAESKGVTVFDYPEIYTEIGPNYLERSGTAKDSEWDVTLNRVIEIDREKKAGNHELCKYCFANSNFQLAEHDHVAFSSFAPDSEVSWLLDQARFRCIHMRSAIPVIVDSGGLASTGEPGHLVYGPYVKIQQEGQYCAELTYLTKLCPLWRAGEFEVTASRVDRNGSRHFSTLARADLQATHGNILSRRVEFNTNGFSDALLETRVYVEGRVQMIAFEIRTWRTDTKDASVSKLFGSLAAQTGSP